MVASACAWSTCGFGLLDEGEHVAHPENPVGHPVGMELLEVGDPLPGRREYDRPAHHLFDREGGAAPGVAVDFGQDHAIEFEGLMEGLGGGDRVLARHGVDHEECEVRIDGRRDPSNLVHELGVDREPAGGVDDQHIAAKADGLFQPLLGDGHGIRRLAEHGHADLLAQDPELLHRGRTLKVGSDEERVPPLVSFVPGGQLGGGGGLTGALETGEEHDRRGPRRIRKPQRLTPEDAP